MTKKDDGFTKRVLIALITEMADRSYPDAKVHVRTLSREHGLADYADKVMGR